MNKNSKTNLNFIEVCSGAGGLSHGFINKGFKPVFLNEIDKVCCQTLRKNHPGVKVIQGDMNDIDPEECEGVDLIMGGVPCQSFSQAGKREGLEDKRGNLILVFSDLISKSQPRAFLVENVVGLTTHNKGETFRQVLEELNKDGNYRVYHKILNANDFGVAQKRKRLFIVGIRKDVAPSKEFTFPKPEKYKPVLRDVLENVPESSGYEYPEEKRKVMELVPPGGCWVNLPEDVQKEYMKKSYFSGGGKRGIARRLSMDEPCLTLTTSPCQKQTERCHPEETRPFTVREYARIQSFPDDFEFCGTKAQQYKQIGNAVPVKLAERVALALRLFFLRSSNREKL